MCVENPLLAFIDLVNKLRAGDVLSEDLKQRFSQVGINFISDSYRTALCLESDLSHVDQSNSRYLFAGFNTTWHNKLADQNSEDWHNRKQL